MDGTIIMKKLSIIIPCYNEEKGVGKVIDGVPVGVLRKLGYETEIIAIDNNSKDKTAEVAKAHGATVYFEKIQGKVAALKKGFKEATGEIFITIDGDNTYPSREIPTLIRALDGNDLVIGTRFNSVWDIPCLFKPRELPFQRVIANKIGAELGSLILGHRITDVTTGLRAFRSDLLSRIPPIKAKGLDFEAELTARVISNKLIYKEVRITSNAREGHSSLNYFRDALRFLWAMIAGKYDLGASEQSPALKPATTHSIVTNQDMNISIVILTKNAGKMFKSVLDAIYSQTIKTFEVIVIDSGSTDMTLRIANNYPVKIINIAPEEFGHGKTRNLGANIAKGSHVVYITQDAKPHGRNWLKELIKPFSDVAVAGVYGRQIPKKNENIIDKFFYLSLYSDEDMKWEYPLSLAVDSIFSDVNSAIRKDILLEYPFNDDILVSEDHEWAHRILKEGYSIFYNSKASVIHSHTYSLKGLFKRHFDIGVSYNKIQIKLTLFHLLKKGASVLRYELGFIIKNGYFYYIPYCLLKDSLKFIALTFGKNERIFPKYVKAKLSNYERYWL